MAPQQELVGLREGFAEHGEAWLRQQLQKQSAQQLCGLAGAAGLPRYSGNCPKTSWSRPCGGALPSRRHPLPRGRHRGEWISYLFCAWVRFRVFLVGFWKFCQDDDVAVSQQELNGLREGFAQHGEAWLRERLRERSFPQLRGLAGAAGLPRVAANCPKTSWSKPCGGALPSRRHPLPRGRHRGEWIYSLFARRNPIYFFHKLFEYGKTERRTALFSTWDATLRAVCPQTAEG